MIESVVCYNITLLWFTITSVDKTAIKRIYKHVTKTNILSIDDMYIKYVTKKVEGVVSMETHPFHKYISYVRLTIKTQAYRKSFVQNSIHLFNIY